MIDWKRIYTSEDKNLLKSLINEGVPIEVFPREKNFKEITKSTIESPMVKRSAAMRLYELGEKDYAFEVLINQMLQYKNPHVPNNIKYETCTETIIALGQLVEKRAIEYLIEAMDEFSDIPAFALALINGTDLIKRLLDLSIIQGIRGFGATLSLGFMNNKDVLPNVIEILEHTNEYQQKYRGKIMWQLRDDIMYMLGNYDNETAREVFIDRIQLSDIKQYARNYEIVERRLSYFKYTDLSTLGWKIVKKYSWDKYLDTNEKRFVFSGYVVNQWGKVYNTPCPFKSDAEVEKIRDGIIEKIWREIKGDTR